MGYRRSIRNKTDLIRPKTAKPLIMLKTLLPKRHISGSDAVGGLDGHGVELVACVQRVERGPGGGA